MLTKGSPPITASAAPKGSKGLLAALFVAELGSPFPAVIMLAALPAAIREFHDPVRAGWLITIFLLVSVAAVAAVGRLGDIVGRRRVLLGVLALSAVGSAVSAFAPSLDLMLAGRAVQGVSGAIMPLAVGILREQGDNRRLPIWIGYLTMSAAIATGGALIVGGLIVDNFAWPAIFVATGGLAVIGFLLVAALVPASRRKESRPPFDWLGMALFVPAVAALMIAISSLADPSARIRGLALTLCGVALLVIFDRRERSVAHPMVNVRLLRHRQILIANLCIGIGAAAAYLAAMIMSLQLQQPVWTGVGLGLGAAVVGLWKLPSNILGSVGSLASGHVVAARGARAALVAGGIVLTVGWLAVTVHHSTILGVALANVVIAFGFQMIYPAANAAIIEICDPRETSEATAFMQISRGAVTALGAQLITILLALDTAAAPPGESARFPSEWSYLVAMATMTALCAVCAMAAAALPRTKKAGSASGRVARS